MRTTARGPSMQLWDGSYFYLLDPNPEVMTPENIAHALANLCRFTGHCRFYSVAQHCRHVSFLVPREHAFAGLMHDASEAFIGDLSRPLKDTLDVVSPGTIRMIEDRIHAALAKRYGFEFPFHPSVKVADNIAVVTERRDAIDRNREPWPDMPEPDPMPQAALPPELAERMWLERFRELTVGVDVGLHGFETRAPGEKCGAPECVDDGDGFITTEYEAEFDPWEGR